MVPLPCGRVRGGPGERMTRSNIKLGLACLVALAWSASARAEEEKDWFESEPDESKGESSADEESPPAAPQEEGGIAIETSKRGSWLTQGSIALWGGVHLGMGGNLHVEAD